MKGKEGWVKAREEGLWDCDAIIKFEEEEINVLI